MELDELMNMYGSDKARNGYVPMYHSFLKHLRDRPIDLLEVGIGTMIPGVPSSMVGYSLPGYAPGGSLRAWRDYFPNGHIVGVDIQPDTQFTDARIQTYLADSSSKERLDIVLENRMFDVIIDDGLHYDETQVKTMENLWHRVRPGGYYVIEDITEWSRIPNQFRSRIEAIVGSDGFFFLTEKKNVLIASRKPASLEQCASPPTPA
jgi:SAM-dependent methyltransferase